MVLLRRQLTCAAFLSGWWVGSRSHQQKPAGQPRPKAPTLNTALDTNHWMSLNLAQVEARVGLKFPAGTKLIHGELFAWQGNGIWAELNMTGPATVAFLQAVKPTKGPSASDRYGVEDQSAAGARRLAWWKPDAVTQFVALERAVQTKHGEDTTALLLSTASGPDQTYIAYLYWTGEKR